MPNTSFVKANCVVCGKEYLGAKWHVNNGKRVSCSIKCRGIRTRTQQLGPGNSNWAGKSAGYGAIHDWIRRNKPKLDACEGCGEVPPRDLANISGDYMRDIRDFEWLCRLCHMTSDGRRARLSERITHLNITRHATTT